MGSIRRSDFLQLNEGEADGGERVQQREEEAQFSVGEEEEDYENDCDDDEEWFDLEMIIKLVKLR